MLHMGRFRSVSLWEEQWLQNTLLKEKVLREGWDIQPDAIAAICTDFSEALFEAIVKSS